eukprot:Skav200460  [mRNA]  locus=scaffold4319:43647:53613:+ [translate_table: standard]
MSILPKLQLAHEVTDAFQHPERHPDTPRDSQSSDASSDDLDIDALLVDLSHGLPPSECASRPSRPSSESPVAVEVKSSEELFTDTWPAGAPLPSVRLAGSLIGDFENENPEQQQLSHSEGSILPQKLLQFKGHKDKKNNAKDIVHQPQPPSIQHARPSAPFPEDKTGTEEGLREIREQKGEGKPMETRRGERPRESEQRTEDEFAESLAMSPLSPKWGELNARRAEAERLWKQQIVLQTHCDILRSISCVKRSAAFAAVTAELKHRVCLQSEITERLDSIRSFLSSAKEPGKEGKEDQKERQKERSGEVSRSGEISQQKCFQLDREARRLHAELLSKIRLRAEAEAKTALAEAKRKAQNSQQWRTSAKASLEMRKRHWGSTPEPKTRSKVYACVLQLLARFFDNVEALATRVSSMLQQDAEAVRPRFLAPDGFRTVRNLTGAMWNLSGAMWELYSLRCPFPCRSTMLAIIACQGAAGQVARRGAMIGQMADRAVQLECLQVTVVSVGGLCRAQRFVRSLRAEGRSDEDVRNRMKMYGYKVGRINELMEQIPREKETAAARGRKCRERAKKRDMPEKSDQRGFCKETPTG